MKISACTILCTATLMLAGGTASADPWKDESGKGRWRGDYDGAARSANSSASGRRANTKRR
jgi:hypothetical protein